MLGSCLCVDKVGFLRYNFSTIRPVRLSVRTRPSQGRKTSAILVQATWGSQPQDDLPLAEIPRGGTNIQNFMNKFFGGEFESWKSDVSRDERSPEEKKDFETRKERMIVLAEKERCLSHILILLQLADVQAGFSDEGVLFDYDERNKHRHVVRGGGVAEPENQMRTFRKYAMSQSDWLRSLYAFMEAIRTDENTPGLFEIINTQQDEWRRFEQWCQGKFLNATALLQVKKALQKDERINWVDLQTFPIEKIRRVILDF